MIAVCFSGIVRREGKHNGFVNITLAAFNNLFLTPVTEANACTILPPGGSLPDWLCAPCPKLLVTTQGLEVLVLARDNVSKSGLFSSRTISCSASPF